MLNNLFKVKVIVTVIYNFFFRVYCIHSTIIISKNVLNYLNLSSPSSGKLFHAINNKYLGYLCVDM